MRAQFDDCANVCCGALVLASSLKLDVVPLTPPIICYGSEAQQHWSQRL
jgi:hypothetical protein